MIATIPPAIDLERWPKTDYLSGLGRRLHAQHHLAHPSDSSKPVISPAPTSIQWFQIPAVLIQPATVLILMFGATDCARLLRMPSPQLSRVRTSVPHHPPFSLLDPNQ